MTRDKLAKLMLTNDVDPKFMFVYELSKDGCVDEEVEIKLQEYLEDSKFEYIRVIHPKQLITMDYRMDRLNISVDENNKIEDISIG